jgi:hypothetical protein
MGRIGVCEMQSNSPPTNRSNIFNHLFCLFPLTYFNSKVLVDYRSFLFSICLEGNASNAYFLYSL